MDAAYWIEKLNLSEHPEGGFFRETYRSSDLLTESGLPERFGGSRSASTAIYFLITHERPSHIHRMEADEVWHFYDGDPLTLHLFHPDGKYEKELLGRDIERGEEFQRHVPSGCWFGGTVDRPSGFALVGCTVAPGFDFDDFRLARRSELLLTYPDHAGIIERLTGPDQTERL